MLRIAYPWSPGVALAMMLPALALGQVNSVLVEAEGFDTKGGWKVDTQAVEQMGSVYLIAHGLGSPVADASTTVTVPVAGDYRLWVRTRNWVPGAWEAPGRFRVAVGGGELAAEFGIGAGDWQWQDGGVVTLAGGAVALALRDLTGFDGRCDAVALVRGSDDPPPAGGGALAAWRRAVLAEAPAPANQQSYDCVVVGGGIAGCCAAFAAAEGGCTVALVQDRPFLGGNASQEVRVGTRGEIRHSIVEMFKSGGDNGSDGTIADDVRRLGHIQGQPNITLLMPWRAEGVVTGAGGRITHVDVRETRSGERARLQAPVFIDCTGDGWVGFWAGADHRVGREGAAEFGESLAPAAADAMTMGNSLMWKSKDTGAPSGFPAVPWAIDVAGSSAETNGGWNWEYGMHLDTIADTEQIRDHLLRAIYGNFFNAKQNPANANRALDWVPYVSGKRESRRLMGDHVIIEDDIRNGVFFEDAVGTATWPIDLHYPTAVSYRSTYTPTQVAKWYFPFRSLYSRNIPNLMMAGRCISVSHVGLGSPRVQNTTGQMGVAVGYAASLCKEHGIEPRDIYRDPDRMLELQARIGGSWPERPVNPGTVIVDNADIDGGFHLTGSWNTSNSNTGYYGSDYSHDQNTGKGSKNAVFVATIPVTGENRLELRWAAAPNRASNVPVWLREGLDGDTLVSDGTAHIRNAQPGTNFSTDEILVGRVAPNDYLRGLLHFDLAGALPAGASVVGARLELTIRERDATSQEFVGADGIRVYAMQGTFQPAAANWNQRDTGQPWTTAGGDFDTEPLAIIGSPTDPDAVNPGEVFGFAGGGSFAAVVRNALGAGGIGLVVRTPGVESSYNARKLYRFASAAHANAAWRPRLVVSYCLADGAPDFVVDQRVNGDQWNELTTVDLQGGDTVCVVLGTGGTNGYVIADAVRWSLADGPLPYTDRDGDLLPDWWERWYYLSETLAGADWDTDGDGRDSYTEFLTGTDPLDPGSFFSARMAMDGQPGEYELRWPSVDGTSYRIEYTEDLAQPFRTLVEGIDADPPENAHTVTLQGNRCFYRVVPEG